MSFVRQTGTITLTMFCTQLLEFYNCSLSDDFGLLLYMLAKLWTVSTLIPLIIECLYPKLFLVVLREVNGGQDAVLYILQLLNLVILMKCNVVGFSLKLFWLIHDLPRL
uniref:Uncharacterized protein At5g03900ic-like n=1 Tax=Rhizophora mucronata TaxID=61149 RepID=A0A2P2MW34_RHIMU